LIPQEPEIFEENIAFNITMWSDIPLEKITEYAQLARFHDIALWLPHGYDTDIKEKWVNLSWWQKQRLALARGLLVAEDSSIVLLDESTSSVDSINEKKIYTSIFHHFADKTVIAAIHKLHLLTMFDTIYVFDKGKVIESGSFHGLIGQWGMLSKMREEYQASQKKK
jgi:ABC-type multidrug transport system fused ATPase/permease subunit